MKWPLYFIAMMLCGCSTVQFDQTHPVASAPLPIYAVPPLPPMPIVSESASTVIIPHTITLTLMWDYPTDMVGIVGFRLYLGTNSGSYFQSFSVGLTNMASITFNHNAGEVNYFVATSIDGQDLESLPSNEVFWPAATIFFNAPFGVIEESENLSVWRDVGSGPGSGVKVPKKDGPHFYRVRSDRPTVVRIQL